MSRHNKVNPGQYTQRGRLSQDDAAREIMRQRESIASQNYQDRKDSGPVPWAEPSTPANPEEPVAQEEKAAAPVAKKKLARTAVKAKAKRKASAPVRKARSAKSAKPTKPTVARSPRPVRKAALARSVVRKPARARTKAKSKT